MASIFISYRREDSAAYARLLSNGLQAHFGAKHHVFMDLDSIEPGEDFVDAIKRTVSSCEVLIAVIGKQWLASADEQGRARLQNPEDFVRVEIQTALDRQIRVIPALVGGARMPGSQDLPPELTAFARRNAFPIHDDSFAQSMRGLIESLDKALAPKEGPRVRDEAPALPKLADTPPPVAPPVSKAPEAPEGKGFALPRWQVLAAVGAALALVVVVVLWWTGRDKGPGDTAKSSGSATTVQAPKQEKQTKETAPPQTGPATAVPNIPIKTADTTPPSPQPNSEAKSKASTSGLQTRTNSKDSLVYVWIPPGRFTMGCSQGDSECLDREKPAHEVIISKGFWLGQTEVTQEAYQKVTGKPNPSRFKGASLPVEKVSWNDADNYCRASGGRLPTEAEWEYAARAGTAGSRYGDIDNIAWYRETTFTTHEVAQKTNNAWGLYDTLGNVWEWVADWYGAYSRGSVTDPHGPASGQRRLLRGGSWAVVSRFARVSYRYFDGPEFRDDDIGFRCAGE